MALSMQTHLALKKSFRWMPSDEDKCTIPLQAWRDGDLSTTKTPLSIWQSWLRQTGGVGKSCRVFAFRMNTWLHLQNTWQLAEETDEFSEPQLSGPTSLQVTKSSLSQLDLRNSRDGGQSCFWKSTKCQKLLFNLTICFKTLFLFTAGMWAIFPHQIPNRLTLTTNENNCLTLLQDVQ